MPTDTRVDLQETVNGRLGKTGTRKAGPQMQR